MNKLCLTICCLISSFIYAQNIPCAPSYNSNFINIGQTNVQILSGGDMYWDLANSLYEVPKGGGIHSIFAASLWMGGIDQMGDIHLAAQNYRQSGNDFWPGPIRWNNEPQAEDCLEFDQVYSITRAEVALHLASFNHPQYIMSENIKNWPGSYLDDQGQTRKLARFVDLNQNNVYEPQLGEYPAFDFNNTLSCEEELKGDQILFKVYNDIGDVHAESGGLPIGAEIREYIYAFAGSHALAYQVFHEYEIFNNTPNTYSNFRVGVWADIDLGNYQDDFVGSDVGRGLAYGYNGDPDDEGQVGYGLNPPAVGICFLDGPLADPNDGVDNDRDFQIDEPGERIPSSGFVYYNNVNGAPDGNPQDPGHYYNYLGSLLQNGAPIGNYNGRPITYMFPGDSDTLIGWSAGGTPNNPNPVDPGQTEYGLGNVPSDRRFVLPAGPFTFSPGSSQTFSTATIWARASSGGPLESLSKLRLFTDTVKQYFDQCFDNIPCEPSAIKAIYQKSEFTYFFALHGMAQAATWEFGDGSISSGLSSNHTYSAPGDYEVIVSGTSACGAFIDTLHLKVRPNELVGPQLTRLEGRGNGGQTIRLTHNSVLDIVQSPSFAANEITYKSGAGPIQVYTFDPSSVPSGNYEIRVRPKGNDLEWILIKLGTVDTVFGNISPNQDQDIFLPQYNLWVQTKAFDQANMTPLDGWVHYLGNPKWIDFLKDDDLPFYGSNWIRTGFDYHLPNYGPDPNEAFEKRFANGRFAPYRVVSTDLFDTLSTPKTIGGGPGWDLFQSLNKLNTTPSVRIVLTSDQSLWTRVPVVETGENISTTIGGARKYDLRRSASVDKNGAVTNTNTGWSWFPGYAVNMESGERLNIMFGENSSDPLNNGTDMVFNPTSRIHDSTNFLSPPMLGGRHFIYIMKSKYQGSDETLNPHYNDLVHSGGAPANQIKRQIYKEVAWVSIPLKADAANWLDSEVHISLQGSKQFETMNVNANPKNMHYPRYSFSTQSISIIEQEAFTWSLYPNPSNGLFHYEIPSEFKKARLQVFSVDGRQVLDEVPSAATGQFDLRNLANGIYLVLIEVDGNRLMRKIAKQ